MMRITLTAWKHWKATAGNIQHNRRRDTGVLQKSRIYYGEQDRYRYRCAPQPYAASAMYDGTVEKTAFSACAEDVPYLLGCISSAYRTKSGVLDFLMELRKRRYASESVQI